MKKYLKVFQYHEDYMEYKSSDSFLKPNVSECMDEGDVHYNPFKWADEYLTFKALEGGSFTLNIGSAVSTSILESISYSTDNGQSWETTNNVDGQTVTIVTPTVNAGDSVLWKGLGSGVSTVTNNNNRPSTSSMFSSTGTFNVEGNILSLLYGDEFEGKDSVTGTYNFAFLFYADKSRVSDVPKVVSAKNLVLPIKNTPEGCYLRMFQEYQLEEYTLVEAPLRIDSESVGASACTSMFYSCTNLTTAPELPATTLANYCYASMFYGCTNLTTAPELPATTLSNNCYRDMFEGCTSLTTAPELPATTLAQQCYQYMFKSCTSLTTAPALPATTLAQTCYEEMFNGCTSLTTAPELPATTLANSCYKWMFQNCTSLTTAPELPATTLATGCYNFMFYGCTSLNYIKAMFTTTPSYTYTREWVSGVASTGTFVKNSAATWNVSGVHGIPTGWTVETASS